MERCASRIGIECAWPSYSDSICGTRLLHRALSTMAKLPNLPPSPTTDKVASRPIALSWFLLGSCVCVTMHKRLQRQQLLRFSIGDMYFLLLLCSCRYPDTAQKQDPTIYDWIFQALVVNSCTHNSHRCLQQRDDTISFQLSSHLCHGRKC